MTIVHASTMIIVNACTTVIMHVYCPTWLMFDEIEGGVQGGEAPQRAGGSGGAPSPQHITSRKPVIGKGKE